MTVSSTWPVEAREVRPGNWFRSLGPGFRAREITDVGWICNCRGTSRSVDPETGDALHFMVIKITSADLTQYARPHSTVWLTDDSL